MENVWQNGFFALDDVNPQQEVARSSFFRFLLRRQKLVPALDRLPMQSPFQNRRLAQLLQEPELKPLQEPCQRGSKIHTVWEDEVKEYSNALFGCTYIYLNPHVLKWN